MLREYKNLIGERIPLVLTGVQFVWSQETVFFSFMEMRDIFLASCLVQVSFRFVRYSFLNLFSLFYEELWSFKIQT
jgi:predicted cupin superfamily sugar epimerase